MRVLKKSVSLIPLKDFGSSPFLEHGIFVEEFEECVSIRHKRMEVHRHDYVELFLLRGQGSVLMDFEVHALSGKSLVAIGPGRVHAWQANKMTGLYVAFTQELFDGAGPPPSTLFDYPFLFGGEFSELDVSSGKRQNHQSRPRTLVRQTSWKPHGRSSRRQSLGLCLQAEGVAALIEEAASQAK